MNPSRLHASRLRATLSALALSAAVLASNTAFAHIALVSATPAADSHVASAERIDLTFNETLVPRASRVTLSRLEGRTAAAVDHVETTILTDGKTLRATPMHALPHGSYRVEWRAVGADNHPMTGSYEFMIH